MLHSNDVEFLGGPADEFVQLMDAPPPNDVMCAQQVKGSVMFAAGATVGTLGVGLYGVYKLFKGRPAAGVTALVASILTLGIGRAVAVSAAQRFETCRTAAAPQPKLPNPGPTYGERVLHRNVRTGSTFYYGDPGYGGWLAAQGNDQVVPVR